MEASQQPGFGQPAPAEAPAPAEEPTPPQEPVEAPPESATTPDPTGAIEGRTLLTEDDVQAVQPS